ISATTVSMSNWRRPQVGQAISSGPRCRSLSALRISQATLTSSSAWKVESEMRMVSPMPSARSVPRPTADFSEPDHLVPASVMPRCSGYGIFVDSRRLAAIVFGTFVDLIETLKSWKSSRSISSTNSTAAATSASTGFSRSSSCRCLGSEPELTPMRIGVPAAVARAATSATLSGPPMLPGFRRTQWAPASIALSASVWLKWMSAMIGIGDSATIVLRASTSLSRGTATRTMSAPASATFWIWSMVAVRFAVSVLVIVWTATGAPPPMGTPPTNIWRLEDMYLTGYLPTTFDLGGSHVRRTALLTAVIASFFAFAASASASYLQDRISEVHAGAGGVGDYVELQIPAGVGDGNLVSSHYIYTYSSGSVPLSTTQIPNNVGNGNQQRTILISDGMGTLPGGVVPDITAPSLNVATGGGDVCYMDTPSAGIDCVAYGTIA